METSRIATIRRTLKKENLYLKAIKDSFGNTAWMVVDINNVVQAGEWGMSPEELEVFAGQKGE